MMINELKMTEIKTLSWTELEMLVNDLKKKHTNKGLTDLETTILRGIFDDKKYADLAEEISQEEQSIKNAAHKLWKILSEQMGEKIDSNNLITALARYRDNSQTFAHNNKPQTQQSDKVFELVIEVGIDDLTPEKIDKINNLIQKIARDNTIKPIMKQVIEKDELIKAIREGTIDKTTLQQVDLSGAILRRVDLRRADLSEADLSDADLSDAILIEANLSKANLSGANLSGADLRKANLSKARLSAALLKRWPAGVGKLSKARLSGANLSGADVKNAIFIGATGITREQKQDLIRRGAIFGDTSNDRSKVLV